jgi:hypothetical protein
VVTKFTVFRLDTDGDLPCLVFWVADRLQAADESVAVESVVVRRAGDGKSVVREHVFRAKL